MNRHGWRVVEYHYPVRGETYVHEVYIRRPDGSVCFRRLVQLAPAPETVDFRLDGC